MSIENTEVVETTETIETQAPEQSREEKIAELSKGLFTKPTELETETEPEPEPEPVVDSSRQEQLDKLVKMERRILEREMAIKEREKELQSQSNPYGLSREEMEDLKQNNPKKLVEQLGIDFSHLAQQIIDEDEFNENRQMETLQERLDRLEREKEESDQRSKQQNQAQAYQAYRQQVLDFVETNDKYELTKALGKGQLVVDTIMAEYQRSNKELSPEIAADSTEKYLEDQIGTELGALLQTNKGKELLQKLLPDSQAHVIKKPAPTLTNKSASFMPSKSGSKPTKEERWRRIAELEKNLHK